MLGLCWGTIYISFNHKATKSIALDSNLYKPQILNKAIIWTEEKVFAEEIKHKSFKSYLR